jgi:hypothetical protein
VTANGGRDLSLIAFLEGKTGGITADFQRGRFLGLVVLLRIALDGDDLPAAA